jgi:hypothetical protein
MAKGDYGDLFGGKFLSASDVDENGVIGTIERTEVVKMRDGNSKLAVYFEEDIKPAVVNKTRAKFLADLSDSKDFEDWIGLQVKIVAGETNFGGDVVPCIAFKKVPAAKKPTKAADDAPGFAE